MNAYIHDIQTQSVALREAAEKYSPKKLDAVQNRLQNGEFDRIIISGMGASFNAAYPAYLSLSQSGLPVNLVNTAELLNYLLHSIGSKTLLWLNSQSGRSVEMVRLLAALTENKPACLIACVNDVDSPLALAADVCLPIFAGDEATVSVKTYSNMLAVNLFAACQLNGQACEPLRGEIIATAEQIGTFLNEWNEHLATLAGYTSQLDQLVFLGRGSSLAATWNGALIAKEAAKCAFEGLHAAEFRHGPLEIAQAGFCAVIFAGSLETLSQNFELAKDIERYGGKVIWAAQEEESLLATFRLPETTQTCLPLVEILVPQLLSVVMAQRKNIEPGYFRYVDKVTLKE